MTSKFDQAPGAHTLTLRKSGDIETDYHDSLEDAMAFAAEECQWESTDVVRVYDEGGEFCGDYEGWNR